MMRRTAGPVTFNASRLSADTVSRTAVVAVRRRCAQPFEIVNATYARCHWSSTRRDMHVQ